MTSYQVAPTASAATAELRNGRGISRRLLDPESGISTMVVSRVTVDPLTEPGPFHLHEHADNVYVVLDGVLEVRTSDAVFLLQAGDAIFIGAGEPHGTHNPARAPVSMLAIYNAPVHEDFVVVNGDRS